MRSRVRGRRVALLTACVLPLLAHNDAPMGGDELFYSAALILSSQSSVFDDADDSGDAVLSAHRWCRSRQQDLKWLKSSPAVFNSSKCGIPFRPFYLRSIDYTNICPYIRPYDRIAERTKESPRSGNASTDAESSITQTLKTGTDDNDMKSSEATFLFKSGARVDSETLSENDALQLQSANATLNITLSNQRNFSNISINSTASKSITLPKDESKDPTLDIYAVDYASKMAGAVVLETSRDFQGAYNLLTKDKDKYAIVPCADSYDNHFVVIGLSEDILVKRVILANYERYSSPFRVFNLLGSTTAVSNNWITMGTHTLALSNGKQLFDLSVPVWARYLKFQFTNNYGDEDFCTLSQISVHGSTVLQGFHEQWEDDGEDSDGSDDVEETSYSCDDVLVNATGVVSDAFNETSTEEDSSGEHERRPYPHSKEQEVCTSCPVILPTVLSANGSDASLAWGALLSASVGLSSTASAIDGHLSKFKLRTARNRKDAIVVPTSRGRDSHRLIATDADRDAGDAKSHELQFMQAIAGRIKATGINLSLEGIGLSIRGLSFDSKTKRDDSIKAEAHAAVLTTSFGDEKSDATANAIDGKETLPQAVASQAESDSKTDEHIEETHVVLSRLLERYPSSSCLEALDFGVFKSMHSSRKKLGPDSDSSASAMEPVFKKLKDEIRTLQGNVAVHDQFAKQSLVCYQRVLLDMFVDLESSRLDHLVRLEKLENELGSGIRLMIAVERVILKVLYGVVKYLRTFIALCLDVAIIKDFGVLLSFLRLLMASALAIFAFKCTCCVLNWRRDETKEKVSDGQSFSRGPIHSDWSKRSKERRGSSLL
jgi:hypothetical protein